MDQQPTSSGMKTAAVIASAVVLLSGVALASYWWGMQGAPKNTAPKTTAPSVSTNKEVPTASSVAVISSQSLSVTAPVPNQSITSPVRVAGSSNFFEAHTSIRVKDGNGKVLSQSFATAAGWMDQLYPFATYISYGKPATANGTVEVFEASAQDGSDVNLISIPITFADAKNKEWSAFSPNFENSIVNAVQQGIGAELAVNLNFVIDATECCGAITKAKALPQITSHLQYTKGLINFSQDTEQVKNLREGKDAEYLSKYIIGISEDNFLVGYHVGAGGKVDDVFYSGSILPYK
jgi:hypothetical protein